MLLTTLPTSRVEEIASRRHITMTQVAVAWSLSREGMVKWRCFIQQPTDVRGSGVCALVINVSSTEGLLDAIGTFVLFAVISR